jgi:hypothetical protein
METIKVKISILNLDYSNQIRIHVAAVFKALGVE